MLRSLPMLVVCLTSVVARADEPFDKQVAPILEEHCLRCHQGKEPKGALSLETVQKARQGGESGELFVPGDPDSSLILDYITGDQPEMPKNADPLSTEQIESIRQWIAAGAKWPADRVLKERKGPWWSLEPLVRPAVPPLSPQAAAWCRTPVDRFIRAELSEQKLAPNPEADRRTLIRRLFFDLIGLPPSAEEVEAFVNDSDPQAYEQLVDRLLASQHYGERWARHWLDVVHYGDTHGYDKDKLRPNAWPYRDYVIRSFNQDKPYARFVQEQLAGDVLFPGTADGIVATGFIAAGPWDFVGHVELAESKLDGKIARNLDRDDMVTATMNTFVSLTAQCARCHDHKFDPIRQYDYYALQSVFAAVDRANRPYDVDPAIARRRAELTTRQRKLTSAQQSLEQQIARATGPELPALDKRIAELKKQSAGKENPAFGYHSRIESRQDVTKWVQVDLGQAASIENITLVGCHDNFAGIGAGFGFPVRFKMELSNDPKFEANVTIVADHTAADFANPGVEPRKFTVDGKSARYVRVTATRLAPRQNDYIFALGELIVARTDQRLTTGIKVTSLDSIQAAPRWRRSNLVDGYYYGMATRKQAGELAKLTADRELLLSKKLTAEMRMKRGDLTRQRQQVDRDLANLPKQKTVYAAATHFRPDANFRPTAGRPREIRVLQRGSVKTPGERVVPGALPLIPGESARFELPADHAEGQRRAALAGWITHRDNPLTWRSIVNRIWHYHFGRGIVSTPNDFGRMGARPTHPELLDWLAVEFRDNGGSLKSLHRLLATSSVYRQSSAHHKEFAQLDGGNQYLWRFHRRRLEAEAIRDSVLATSGKLNRKQGGPGFRPFGFKNDHSPHYKYHEYNPDDPASHRRAIYRFIVRSVPDPFMTTLDCADPSLCVARRNETLTALQALTLLNNKFMVRMAKHFADRVKPLGKTPEEQAEAAMRLALGRTPAPEERAQLAGIIRDHGLANACRLIFNLNEFVFVD